MTSVSIDNSPVSITLSTDERTSVPAGEVWKVTISYNGEMTMNGSNWQGGGTIQTVLSAGDAVKAGSTGTDHVHIGGFKV